MNTQQDVIQDDARKVVELVPARENHCLSIASSDMAQMKICGTQESVLSLSQKHRIVLLFLRQFGCCFCKEAILDLSELLPSLLKLNTVPVLVHQEPNEYAVEMFKSFNRPAVLKLLHVEDPTGNTFYQMFGVQTKDATVKETILEIAPRGAKLILTKGLTNNLVVPKELCSRVSVQRQPGLFIVEKGQVVIQFYYPSIATRPDYLKVLMDLNGASETTVDLQQIDVLQNMSKDLKVPPLLVNKNKQQQQSLSCFVPFAPKPVVIKEETVKSVLVDKQKRKYLKVHMTREHCSENIIFWEQVTAYKTLQMASLRNFQAQQIIKSFLEPESFLQVNINQKAVTPVKARLNQEGPVIDLFDMLVSDIEVNTIADSFGRFVQTDLYKEMIKL